MWAPRGAPDHADALAGFAPAIVADYRAALRELGNEIADPPAWEPARRQAHEIIDDCVAALRYARRRPTEDALAAATGLGMRRPPSPSTPRCRCRRAPRCSRSAWTTCAGPRRWRRPTARTNSSP
ncbi:hypothetical protein [Streptomyces pactum]|uniref:hypothetical protein n=1 Tax=Streptomyces pactum TaxID=68249 RepID=UPI0036FE4092